jgi:glycosyltransferase involved in cell wall biosynthesis
VALNEEEIERLRCHPVVRTGAFRLLSLGRLLHWKGFELALRAFAQFQREFPASEYWLIGDGPERKSLESLAREFGVAGKVIFWGEMTRRDVLQKLAECDVLLHPSLHDSGGFVSVEAMAAGRPVICLDLGGLALQVTEQTGIKAPAVTPEQVVAELARALDRLARDPSLRHRMGRAARARVDLEFNWKKKGEYLANIYRQVSRNGVSLDPRKERHR